MATANSTHPCSRAKDFPLCKHRASGHWCKTVLGRRHYFGKDKQAALNEWLDEKDDLFLGREPRSRDADIVTLKYCSNYFRPFMFNTTATHFMSNDRPG